MISQLLECVVHIINKMYNFFILCPILIELQTTQYKHYNRSVLYIVIMTRFRYCKDRLVSLLNFGKDTCKFSLGCMTGFFLNELGIRNCW